MSFEYTVCYFKFRSGESHDIGPRLQYFLSLLFWQLHTLDLMENLNIPSFLSSFFSSVDWKDVRIQEPTNFSNKWYSHKFIGPWLRYKISLSLESNSLLWVNGVFSCGKYSLDVGDPRHKKLPSIRNQNGSTDSVPFKFELKFNIVPQPSTRNPNFEICAL